jgi:hypothetical protein
MINSKQVFQSILIAGVHFIVCGVLAAIVFPASFGYALYDNDGIPPWWLVITDHALLLLEAPAALVLYWIYHPTARFEPPHYFVADFVSGSNIPLILGLCALWSLAFGCLAVSAKHSIRRLA